MLPLAAAFLIGDTTYGAFGDWSASAQNPDRPGGDWDSVFTVWIDGSKYYENNWGQRVPDGQPLPFPGSSTHVNLPDTGSKPIYLHYNHTVESLENHGTLWWTVFAGDLRDLELTLTLPGLAYDAFHNYGTFYINNDSPCRIRGNVWNEPGATITSYHGGGGGWHQHGPSIRNDGTIYLYGGDRQGSLHIQENVKLSGSGTLSGYSTSSEKNLLLIAAGKTLTHETGHTLTVNTNVSSTLLIQGGSFVNYGTVDAAKYAVSIESGNSVNLGLFRASAGGELTYYGAIGEGEIRAEPGSTTRFMAGTVDGARFSGTGYHSLHHPGEQVVDKTMRNITVDVGTALYLNDPSFWAGQGSVTMGGTLTLNGSIQQFQPVKADGTVTFNGTGSFACRGSAITQAPGGGSISNNVTLQSVAGNSGSIQCPVVNNGTISANGGTLKVEGASLVNNGRVTSGGGKLWLRGNITGSTGIQSTNFMSGSGLSGATLVFSGANLDGLHLAGPSAAYSGEGGDYGHNTFRNLTIDPGGWLACYLANTNRFSGTLTLAGANSGFGFVSPAVMHLLDTVTLNGAGQLYVRSTLSGEPGATLTNNVIMRGNGASTPGTIKVPVVNNGTITAGDGTLKVEGASLVNNGLVTSGGGKLWLRGNITGPGEIRVEPFASGYAPGGYQLIFSGANVDGGHLSRSGPTTAACGEGSDYADCSFRNFTIDANSFLRLYLANTTRLRGTITVNGPDGQLYQQNTSALLHAPESVTFAGTGLFDLHGLFTGDAGAVLTNNSTIIDKGSTGQLQLPLVNNSVVHVVDANALFKLGRVTNFGLIRAAAQNAEIHFLDTLDNRGAIEVGYYTGCRMKMLNIRVDNSGTITNRYYLNVAQSAAGQGLYQTSTGSITVNVLVNDGSVPYEIHGGRICGYAASGDALSGAFSLLDGVTVAPGLSVGTLNTGALTLGDGFTYECEIGSAGADRIQVTGTATFGATATLRVRHVGEAPPVAGDVTVLTTTTGIIGSPTWMIALPPGWASGPVVVRNNALVLTGLSPATLTTKPGFSAGSLLQLQVTGGNIGDRFHVEASTNLMDWSEIGVILKTGAAPVNFIDTEAPSFRNRFYRVIRSLGD